MKKLLKGIGLLLALVLLVAGCYVSYVFIDYYRLPDMQALEVAGEGGVAAIGEEYRAVSFNIGFGAYSADFGFFMDGGDNARGRSEEEVRGNAAGAIATAQAQDADILFFQEVDVEGDRSRDVDEAAMIREAFAGNSIVFAQNYDSPYLFYPIYEPIGSAVSGIITVSSFGIDSAVRRSLPIDTGVMKIVDLDRCYSVSRAKVDNGKELVMFNVHLSAYTNDEGIVRGQLEMLGADMAAEYAAGNYVICGGDFNCELSGDAEGLFGASEDYSWCKPFDLSLLPEGLTLVPPVDREAPVPSSRIADGPYVPGETFVSLLDGFIVSDNVQVLGANVIDAGFVNSDHNPVYIDFVLLGE